MLDQDLSDHLPVSCKLQFNFRVQNIKTQKFVGNATNNIPKYRWYQNKVQSFLEVFKNNLLQCKNDILQCINIDVNVAVNSITVLYQNAASLMRVCNTNRPVVEQPPWWNVRCDELKQI